MREIIECIPNISEGIDQNVIEAIADSIKNTPDVEFLHQDVGADANRTVFTFIGDTSAVFAAAFALIDISLQLIDLRNHTGAHPRLGAVDVCPFVPIQGIDVDRLIVLHQSFAQKVAENFGLPVYLYELSQKNPARKKLESIRKGDFEQLASRMDNGFYPDLGPKSPHPTAGALVSGVRPFLVALNFSLDTQNTTVAKRIAQQIRTSGYLSEGKRIRGLFKALKSIGWWMPEFGCVQVSCNFTDLDQTSVHEVHTAILELAKQEQVAVLGAELIGLIPIRCFMEAADYYKLQGTKMDKVIAISKKWGLSVHKPFHPAKKIIELLLK